MKRTFDFLVAFVLLLITLPIQIVVAVLVRIFIGKPVLFSQVRPGFKGLPFKVYKFRTMTDKKDLDGNLLPDNERMTTFSRALRRTSLDELPQLVNVLKGDLSLVGPRPLLMEYLDLYNSEQLRRHDVKPGITGWAQINGRNSIQWDEKFKLDLWYVDHHSFCLDLKILLFTVKKVLNREGVNSTEEVPMQRFTGNKK